MLASVSFSQHGLRTWIFISVFEAKFLIEQVLHIIFSLFFSGLSQNYLRQRDEGGWEGILGDGWIVPIPQDQMGVSVEGGRRILSFSLVLSRSTAFYSLTVTSSVLQFCLLGWCLAGQKEGWIKNRKYHLFLLPLEMEEVGKAVWADTQTWNAAPTQHLLFLPPFWLFPQLQPLNPQVVGIGKGVTFSNISQGCFTPLWNL